MQQSNSTALKELAALFLKLGFIAFGGPAAHIAMFEAEVVTKRKWIDRQHFLDLMGATNLIPGPNSTEMTMHIGRERGGIPGLFVAGACFIFPAVLLTGVLAYFYVEYGQTPAIEPFLYGIKPAVLAIILGALVKLGKKALKSWQLGIIGLAVIMAALAGGSEVLVILAAGVVAVIWFSGSQIWKNKAPEGASALILLQATAMVADKSITNTKLFLVFLKVGAVLFGSGYVLVAYLDGELVEKLGWLTRPELLDAIAIGQFTPGPVLSTATFIGYQVNGAWGAVVATLGIFLPSFFFVWLLNPLVPMLRKSARSAAFLDGVNIGAVGIMVAVTLQLGRDILVSWESIVIALLAILFTFGIKKVSPIWIVLGGSLLGYLLSLIG